MCFKGSRFRYRKGYFHEIIRPVLRDAAPFFGAVSLGVAGIGWFVWKGGPGNSAMMLGASTGGDGSPERTEEDPFLRALEEAQKGSPSDDGGTHRLMESLAPLDREGGDPRAHWWLACEALGRTTDLTGDLMAELPEAVVEAREAAGDASSSSLESSRLDLARQHLERVISLAQENREAPALLATVRVRLGDPSEALEVLQEHAERHPWLHVPAAELAGALGDQERRDLHGVAAASHFQRVSENPQAQDRVTARLFWARAELALQNFDRARLLLREGTRLHGAEFPWLAWETRAWEKEITHRLTVGKEDARAVLLTLRQAVEAIGPRAVLVEAAASLSVHAPLADELRAFYRRLTDAQEPLGVPPPSPTEEAARRVALGSLALALNVVEEGLEHLEQAIALQPQNAVALNNLAYGEAFLTEAPNLREAENRADQAIAAARQTGGVPANCWETRGQIRAALGRWTEAAADLERALVGLPGHRKIHQTLAQVYARLNETDLARRHAQRAEELEL